MMEWTCSSQDKQGWVGVYGGGEWGACLSKIQLHAKSKDYLEHAIARNQAKCACCQAAQDNEKSVTREAKQNPKAFKCVYGCMLRP